MEPAVSLAGRTIGNDFTLKDGFRMYHGDRIPGFPVHPHRGFETVTIVMNGWVDHADSLGAAGRYGNGDVQWMTAGSGIQHSEMFPLVRQDNENPLELFQVWLNLPKKNKFASPYFTMFWSDDIPTITLKEPSGGKTTINLIAGHYAGQVSPAPPPESWASDPENDVAIWTITMEPESRFVLPAGNQDIKKYLYFHRGERVWVNNIEVKGYHSVEPEPGLELVLKTGDSEANFLFLQGRPINEPVLQYGPFVMNTEAEIRQTFYDFQKTKFGGWPWNRDDMVHPAGQGRFARYADGRIESKD